MRGGTPGTEVSEFLHVRDYQSRRCPLHSAIASHQRGIRAPSRAMANDGAHPFPRDPPLPADLCQAGDQRSKGRDW